MPIPSPEVVLQGALDGVNKPWVMSVLGEVFSIAEDNNDILGFLGYHTKALEKYCRNKLGNKHFYIIKKCCSEINGFTVKETKFEKNSNGTLNKAIVYFPFCEDGEGLRDYYARVRFHLSTGFAMVINEVFQAVSATKNPFKRADKAGGVGVAMANQTWFICFAKILLERRKKVYKPQMEWLEGEYTKIPQSVQEHLKEKGLDALSKSEAEPFRVILDEIEEGCPEDGYSLEHFTSIIRAYIISDPDRGISPDLDIHIDKSPYLYQGKAKVTAFPTGGSQITLYDIRYGINTRHNDKANFLLRQISIVHELAHIALHGNVERGNIVETPVEHFQAVLFAQLALHKLHEKRIKSGLSPNNEAVITQRVEDAKTAINYAIFKYFNEDIKKQPELDKFLKQLLNPHMP